MKNKKLVIIAIILVIVIIPLIFLLEKKEVKEENKNDNKIVIVDKSENLKGYVCADAIDVFYSDKDYTYSFSCMKSDLVVVKLEDEEIPIKEALQKGIITINDLKRNNIKYHRESK